MAKIISKTKQKKKVETLTHGKAKRLNIPTAEYQSVMRTEELSPVRVAYERRNRDLDPQLVWRGKDERDWSDLVVPAPPLYIQEKVHPKVLIDDLQRRSEANVKASEPQIDLFANFNGLPSEAAKTEFYQHDAHWANRMILELACDRRDRRDLRHHLRRARSVRGSRLWAGRNGDGDRLGQWNGQCLPGPAHRAVGSSRVDLQACKLEYSIVSPK